MLEQKITLYLYISDILLLVIQILLVIVFRKHVRVLVIENA